MNRGLLGGTTLMLQPTAGSQQWPSAGDPPRSCGYFGPARTLMQPAKRERVDRSAMCE